MLAVLPDRVPVNKSQWCEIGTRETSQIDADSICHQFMTFDEGEGVHKFGDFPRLAEPGAEVEAEQMCEERL